MRDLDDPTNRDSVPAMLTPGEFVLNKEAVQMYGPVIEQMNNAGLAARAAGNAAMVQNLNTGGVVGGLFDDDEAWKRYSAHIASIESGGYEDPYSIYGGANNHYVGKYQLGSLAIADGARILGMKKVPTREQVRKDPALQEKLFKAYTKANHGYLKNDPRFKNMSAEEQLDMLGYAHNQGHGGAKDYMKTGVVGTDAFGTKGTKYFMSKSDKTKSQQAPKAEVTQQAVQSAVTNDEAIDVSPSAEAGEASLMPGFVMPNFSQPQMYVPNLSMPTQAPEYIPSVTEKTMKDRQKPGHFNDGGFIGWLGDALFGDEEEKKRRAAALARRPGNRNFDPLQGYMGVPEQPAAPGGGQAPNTTAIPADPEVGGFNQLAPELNNRIAMIHDIPQPTSAVPSIDTAPPVPVRPTVTPDASVNEQLSAKQQWDRLKSERDALPKGHPRRVELSNAMNRLNVANAAVDPREGLRSGTATGSRGEVPVVPALNQVVPDVPSERAAEYMQDLQEFGPLHPASGKFYSDMSEQELSLLAEEGDKNAIAIIKKNNEAKRQEVSKAITEDSSLTVPEIKDLTEQYDDLIEYDKGLDSRIDDTTDMRTGEDMDREDTAFNDHNRKMKDIAELEKAQQSYPEGSPQWEALQSRIDESKAQAEEFAGLSGESTINPDSQTYRGRPSKSKLKNNPAEAGVAVQAGIDKHGETPSEELMAKPVQEVADAGAAAIAKDPGMFKNISSSLKSAFGDLFDSKELARMAVVFAGAMLTGASAGQALAYAGGMYMQRVDARANQYDKLVLSGKYTPESLKTYKDTQDLTDLVPVGEKPVLTGEFEKLYTESGKAIVVQKAKVGDNTIYVDENGKQVNPYKLQNMSKEDRHAYIKTHSGDYAAQIEEFRKQYDIKDDYSITDIQPIVNGKEVAEWALKNGIDPAEMGPLLDSALHEAVNDRRQDGSRARSVVPYLNQLVIRQQVPGGVDLFTVKPADEDGPAQYVNAAKVQKLNQAASNKLKSMGHKGGAQDLANMFYTEAAKDWNALPEAVRKQWNKRAGDDVNGFYLFVEDMLINN